ncbi:hypothetical protein TVAG_266020 [Trichomonas vaginalis G3]|uniref:SCP domain-containing protein n=1 Tax=Trichomonas vaginalis (strain ATCC PRA-98 / G3) TaxID=412133 RepID=A2F2J9_TRIV3|nr:protein-related family [Trichomonas vaginalis G3]EAY00899.1 hypothetical protein TVAG_266020 [Trichomonas vaginalis G3]KAI5489228.1 protein-related family [Trichomonas vaginalis G3]|eukprot:XP_001313828.1 hypothetical protein [Trichomonas vaginalis G3]
MSASANRTKEDGIESRRDLEVDNSSSGSMKLHDLSPLSKSKKGSTTNSTKDLSKTPNTELKLNEEEEYEEDDEDNEVEISQSYTETTENSFNQFDFTNPSSILKFKYRSISATLIRAINLFRNSHKLGNIGESPLLSKLAMKHSLAMAKGETKFSAAPVRSEVLSQPFANFYAHVTKSDSPNHAFLDVANEWATDPNLSKALLSKINVVGVGMASNKKISFFTVICAVKSYIGNSQLVGDELRSVLLGNRCIQLVNKIRKDFDLQTYLYDDYLSMHAYKFCQADHTKITQKFMSSRFNDVSNIHVDFGQVDFEKANPKSIVEEWMHQTQHPIAILGEFNRIGIGFCLKKNKLCSVRIVTRSLHASLIDGSEVLVDNHILAKHVAEEMNDFREQHSLARLNLDDDLFKFAQIHSEYIANGSEGTNPIEDDFYQNIIEPRYKLSDISHTTCREMSRAPKEVMKKWRNNTDCVSVVLNLVDDIGVGLCFDEDYVCHVTVIIADKGGEKEVVNKIVSL